MLLIEKFPNFIPLIFFIVESLVCLIEYDCKALTDFNHFVFIVSDIFHYLFKSKLWNSGEGHLGRLDTDYRGVNRCYEPYRSAYLEWVEKVEDAPGNNYVVVKRNEKRHYTRRDPYTA